MSASAAILIAIIEQYIVACLFFFFLRNLNYLSYSLVSFQLTLFSFHPAICNKPHVLVLNMGVQQRVGGMLMLICIL